MILVTGGTGIVGAHVLFVLVNSGLDIRALQRESSSTQAVKDLFKFYSPNGKTLYEKIEWVVGDILDTPSLEEAMKGCSEIFHCAALVSFSASDYTKLLEVNAEGTANMVNAALASDITEFYYVSSVAAIGRSAKTQYISEATEWEPSNENSGYAVSKHNAEMEVWRGGEEGLKISIVNPTIVLGPGRTSHSSGTLFKAVSDGQKYYTEGENGFIDARDVAFVLKRLYDEKLFSQRYILVGENMSYKAVADSMAEYLDTSKPTIKASKWATGLVWRVLWLASKFTGKAPVLTKESARSSHRIITYDNSKVRAELGITFHTVDQAVKNASAFFRSYPSHL
ncbi:MAG: NAD-dependent epimerase/dehydratase family protein [Flavobacteriales bacterium]